MSVLQVGFGSSGGYTIGKSLRFRASGSASLTRTPLAAGNRRTWTWSGWVKASNTGSLQGLFLRYNDRGTNNFANYTGLFFDGNQIKFRHQVASATVGGKAPSLLLRDPIGWFHVVAVFDTANAAPANRMRLWINGVEPSSYSENVSIPLNTDGFVNVATDIHDIGVFYGATIYPFDGYLSEVHFIDGQALDSSSFGQFDQYGVWQPKKYLGTYGTNGFYLPFSNGSSLANLTADASGNGNNWTANNISLTAGVTYDWMNDTPTNNFAVLNPLALHANNGVISEANLRSNGTNGLGNTSRNASLTVSHKLYLETTMATGWVLSGSVGCFGFIPLGTVLGSGQSPNTVSGGVGLSVSSTNWTISRDNGGASVSLASFAGTAAGVVVQIAYDPANGNIWIGKNGTWYNSGNPETGMNPTLAGISSSAIVPVQNAYADATNTCNFQVNFGQRPFAYTPPAGFLPLCTKNASTPVIFDGDQHMETFTYLGNGGGLQVGEIQRNLEPYTVSKSLRFRASANAYLTRTPSVAGNRRLFTFSAWVKRGQVGRTQLLFNAQNSTNNRFQIAFNSDDTMYISDNNPTTRSVSTSMAFRNISSAYHIQVVVDTDNVTTSDKVKLFCNGVRVALTGTFFTGDTWVNTAIQHLIGRDPEVPSSRDFDGYLSQVHFIDGQALDPSSFGQTDGNGYWVPKQYTGSYGTNGFKLDFADTTSVATLGNDVSGNGNNWTVNNISLTAGATYDSMVDVPGNSYAVSNALDQDRASITTSNGNLTLVKATLNNSPRAASTLGATSGKFYAEITWETMSADASFADYFITGVTTKENWVDTSNGFNSVLYAASDAAGGSNGQKAVWAGGTFSGYSAYGTGYYVNGSVIGIALDLDARTVTFYNNGVSQGAIPLPPTNQPWHFFNTSDGTNNSYTAHWNFGQRPFAYTPPAEFVALSENNIPLDTGNMEYPGLVWIKNRSASQNHAIFDVARGKQAYLSSNTTGVETTDVNSLLEFNKEGFLLGSSSAVNTLGNNYVAWAWKLPQTGVTNTAGSITSTVYANTLAGISAVSYTGTGANATVGHGLGVAPKMVITKNRSLSSTRWNVWHHRLTDGNSALYLDGIDSQQSSALFWNSTIPTSSVFSLGTGGNGNGNGNSMVAYCFAEVEGFSRIGSYTGNGSADGPFLYCGFRPGFVMIKRTDAAGNWYIVDSVRGEVNPTVPFLYPNSAGAEITNNPLFDFVANGFKIRNNASADWNTNGGNYIFLAFAENPFKIARAR